MFNNQHFTDFLNKKVRKHLVSLSGSGTFASAFERERVNFLPFPPNEVLKLRFFQRLSVIPYILSRSDSPATETFSFFCALSEKDAFEKLTLQERERPARDDPDGPVSR